MLSTPNRRLTRSSSRQRESLGLSEEQYSEYLSKTQPTNSTPTTNGEKPSRKRRSISTSPTRKRTKASTRTNENGETVDTIMEEDEEMTISDTHNTQDELTTPHQSTKTTRHSLRATAPQVSPKVTSATPTTRLSSRLVAPLGSVESSAVSSSKVVSGPSSSTSSSFQPVSILSRSTSRNRDSATNGRLASSTDVISNLQEAVETARANLRGRLPDDIHTLVNEVINRCGDIEPYHNKGVINKSNNTLIFLSEALLTAMRNYGPAAQSTAAFHAAHPSPKFTLSDAFCHELGRSLPVIGSAELSSICFSDLFSKSAYAYQMKFAPIPLALRILRHSPLSVNSTGGSMNAPAISNAIKEGDVESVKWLLNMRADITIPDSEGNTPLHYAVRYCPETLSYLFKCGAEQALNTPNHSGNTPVVLAANLHVQLIADNSPSSTTELCTFTSTGTEMVQQEFYECMECPFNGQKGVCSVCAVRCHSGHIQRRVFLDSKGFCDCGESGSSVCKSLTANSNRNNSQSQWPSTPYIIPTFSNISSSHIELTSFTNSTAIASPETIYAYLQMAEKLLLERERLDREDGKVNDIAISEEILNDEAIYGWKSLSDDENVSSDVWKAGMGKDELELLYSRSKKPGSSTTAWLFVFLACVALVIALALHPLTSGLFQSR